MSFYTDVLNRKIKLNEGNAADAVGHKTERQIVHEIIGLIEALEVEYRYLSEEVGLDDVQNERFLSLTAMKETLYEDFLGVALDYKKL